MVLFAWTIVSRWMSNRQQAIHATPAWIVPVVGMLDVPLALPALGLPPMPEVMVLSVAVGLFFAVPLFTLIFSRLVFEAPHADALQPTLMILVAPFAVGFIQLRRHRRPYRPVRAGLYWLTLFVLAVLLGSCASAVLSVPHQLVGGELPARGSRRRGAEVRRLRSELVHTGSPGCCSRWRRL